MNTRSLYMAMVMASLCLGTPLVRAQGGSDVGIGLYTTVQGAVTVTHPRAAKTLPVNVDDEVLFKDLIQTRTESRTKAFFDDDSILTVGEKSRVEITEHIYDPDRNLRRMVVKLVQGRVRALVAKVFNGPGSAFEIHTPTAVAAARGTYFVVWVDNGVTGIVNIGHSGRVDFTSEGKTVSVAPGNYSVAAAGEPPAQPLVYDAGPSIGGVASSEKTAIFQAAMSENIAETVEKTTDATEKVLKSGTEKTVQKVGKSAALAGEKTGNTLEEATEKVGKTLGKADNVLAQRASILASARNAIEGTVLKDVPRLEMAKDNVRASHTPVLATPEVPIKQAAQAGLNATSPSQTTPTVTVTPPAVISGAVPLPKLPTLPTVPLVLPPPTVPVVSPPVDPPPLQLPATLILPTIPVTPPAVISGTVGR